MSNIELKTLPAMRLAGLTHRGSYSQIGPTFESLGHVLGAANAFPQTRGMIGVYYDNPMATPEAELRSHAAAIWSGDGPIPVGLEEVELPAGRFAVLHFKGQYEKLGEAWMGFTPDVIAGLGTTMREGPGLEFHLSDPQTTKPDEFLVDLCVAVN